VRKNIVIDQQKLDVARRALGVTTDKEAIDQALDYIKFYCELSESLETIRLSGGIDDVFKGR
jgi:Arc/MetJ family transcription regulator